MSTTTVFESIAAILDKANPETLADALRRVKLGTILTPLKKTFASLTGAEVHDLTDAEHDNMPPVLMIIALNVTAGAAAAGARMVGDVGATPSATVVALSDDGTTLTFEAHVEDFVIEYIPRSDVDITSAFKRD